MNSLRKAVGWGEVTPPRVARSGIRHSLYCVSAWDTRKIIGMGRVIGDRGNVFYIQDIIVLPEYQGVGVGSGIMKAIMAWLEKNTPSTSNVGLLSAVGKEGFYEKFGFFTRPTDTYGCGMNQFDLSGWHKVKASVLENEPEEN